MLHIIFLIFKILGWILLGILALVLILFGILLLNPVKYKVNGSCKGTLESLLANATVRWLFHLIAADAEYKDGEFKWHLRIAWKKYSSEGDEEETTTVSQSPSHNLSDNLSHRKEKAEEQKSKTGKTEKQKNKTEKADSDHTRAAAIPIQNSVKQSSSANQTVPISDEKNSEPQEKIPVKKQEQSSPQKPEERSESPAKQETQAAPKSRKRQTKQKKTEETDDRDLFERIYDKLTTPFRKLIKKIKYTFRKIYDKVKILIRKKERLQAFLTYEIHKSAFAKAVKELKRLLRFLKPKKLKAEIEFGFSDPAWTGYMLAVLGIAYPFLGEYTEFRPDFEKKILKGRACAEGKIRSIYFLIPALHLLLDKNVRTTYRHIRNFKL